MKDTKIKLSRLTIILHWSIGLCILALIQMGIYMVKIEDFDLYAIHSSIGSILLMVIIFQIIGRIKKGWLPPLSDKKTVKQKVAKIVKWVLFFTALLFPISGILMSVAGGSGLYIFGTELFSANVNPQNAYEMIPLNEGFANTGSFLHTFSEYLMIAAIFLHISGALLSHFIDKEGYLKRMFGRKIN